MPRPLVSRLLLPADLRFSSPSFPTFQVTKDEDHSSCLTYRNPGSPIGDVTFVFSEDGSSVTITSPEGGNVPYVWVRKGGPISCPYDLA